MDYMQFVDYHRSSNADITIGCIAYDETRASDFGLMKVSSRPTRCRINLPERVHHVDWWLAVAVLGAAGCGAVSLKYDD
jgi:hypothetical protein